MNSDWRHRSGTALDLHHAPAVLNAPGRILALLVVAKGPQDMNIPGFKRHALKGGLAEHWSVWVNGNWRVTFRFTEAGA